MEVSKKGRKEKKKESSAKVRGIEEGERAQ